MRKIEFTPSATFNLHELMLNRVYEILLVASPYDAYILEEDGQLTEQILNEYLAMNFTAAPRVWRESTATDALATLSKRKFDLVIVMARISDMDPVTFGAKVKELYPRKPVILLAADETEVAKMPLDAANSSLDKIFVWSGHANVFPTIIKYVEDRQNAPRDVRIGDVRIIIVIEDTPRDYSIILPLIYKVIVNYTNQLVSTSLTAAQRLFHLRGRPKILLTGTYEEAQKYYRRYHKNVLGIISDINFPYKGKKNPEAGLKFAKWVRKQDPVMPIMLQSRDQDIRDLAHGINAHFLYKKSTRLLHDIEEFIIANFGFGDFIFRLPDGKSIAMAASLDSLMQLLNTVPDESFIYHANHNHFSNWLSARGEFESASNIRPLRESHFKSTSEHRQAIIRFIQEGRSLQKAGQVIDFASDSFNPSVNLIRLAQGSMGGKARGLAFAEKILEESEISSKYPEIEIRVPRVAILGTDEFDRFMSHNQLWKQALGLTDNKKIDRLFSNGTFSNELLNTLKVLLSKIKYPLAVRSSSLLEDSPYQSLAGAYTTFMYPNNARSLQARVEGLCNLIKLVYASMFHQEPRAIIGKTTHRLEEEKMAVVIQELAGQRHGDYYYPTFSGVTQNYNYYPVSYMQREEGVAFLALGLGRTIVEGEKALRFSPKYPAILPQFYSIKATLAASQNSFYALRLKHQKRVTHYTELTSLVKFSLDQAEKDGVLKFAGSVISSDDAVIRDSLRYRGTRVVTFAPILKWKLFPLAELLEDLLNIGVAAFGGPVEIEFAVNMPPVRSEKPEFCLVQIRPMHNTNYESTIGMDHIHSEDIFTSSAITLGNGTIDNINNILLVKKDAFNPAKTVDIAAEIERFNHVYGKNKSYILVGPGRWGSADPWLGIPVRWDQISNAKVIVEVGLGNYNIDPSFGSHFFQIVTGMKIGYFTINPKNKTDLFDWDWLETITPEAETPYISWLQSKHCLPIYIDGVTGKGIILKPIDPTQNIEPMDEQESTGI